MSWSICELDQISNLNLIFHTNLPYFERCIYTILNPFNQKAAESLIINNYHETIVEILSIVLYGICIM